MERALKQLLRGYPIIRNWTVLSNYIVPLQFVQSRQLQMHNTDFTDYNQFIIEKNHLITSNIKEQDPMKILKSVATNYTDLSMNDAINLMDTLLKLSKKYNIESIINHAGFTRLCEILNGNIRLMKTSEVIKTLKVLTYFKTSSKTFLMQSLLQVIRTTLNELSLQDIMFTVFLLKKMDSTPLRDALLIALPLVFEAQLPTKLDSDDSVELSFALKFTSQNNIKNPEVQKIIFKSLLKHQHNLSTQVAKSIFYSLCFITDLPPIASEILSNVQYIFITKAKGMDIYDKIKILEILTFAFTNKKEKSHEFYNETLVDAFVSSALSSNIDFGNGINMLKTLNDLNYVHIPFLEYLAAKCFENLSLLEQATFFKVSVFLEGLINADYKPVFWDTIRDAILKNVTEEYITRSLVKFVLHLIALDCYNSNLIDKVFSQNIKSNEAMKDVYAKELLLLYQSVKTLYPMYNGPWPPQDILEYAIMMKAAPAPNSLKAALECALGGPQYVHHNLKTKLGHRIDHMVVMRKGGYPVAINTYDTGTTTYVENIQTPHESQILLIFNLPDIAYAINSPRLKSTWLLKMKSVEALIKSKTIVINSSSWLKLPEYEKVPYLMQAIKLKCDDLSVSVN